MKFYFDVSATFRALDLADACKKISEQFARIAEKDWKGTDPTSDGIFKHGSIQLNAEIEGMGELEGGGE